MAIETRSLSEFSPVLSAPSAGRTGAHLSSLLIGPSPAMAALWNQIRHIAPYFRMLLLQGEPGTGAEAVARVLHDLSPVARLPFHSLSPEEAEAQFAPEGPGSGPLDGTLFFHEVDRLSPRAQVALHRLLQPQGPRTIRVIAFSRAGLRPLTSAGGFVPELATNFGAIRLRLPSLRTRCEDIPLLLEHLLHQKSFAGLLPVLSPAFLSAAAVYTWPGNLDEMDAVLDWLLEQDDPSPSAGALHHAIAAVKARSTALSGEVKAVPLVTLDQIVQDHMRGVLIACNGNKLRAAQVLGISRSTLYRMLETSGSLAEASLAN